MLASNSVTKDMFALFSCQISLASSFSSSLSEFDFLEHQLCCKQQHLCKKSLEAIFLAIMQIAPSYNHKLLIYIACLTSVVSYQSLKGIRLHIKKDTFAPPNPLNERQEGRLLPSDSLLRRPRVFSHSARVSCSPFLPQCYVNLLALLSFRVPSL